MLNILNHAVSLGLFAPIFKEEGPWPLLLTAGIALFLFILLAILSPFGRGMIDVYKYYDNKNVVRGLLSAFIAIILSFIIFFPALAFGGAGQEAIVVLELAILLLSFVFVLDLIKSGAIEYRKSSLNVLFFILAVYLLLQTLNTSMLPYQAFLSLKLILLYFALYIVIVNSVHNKKELDSIIFKIIIAGLVVSVIAIAQWATKANKIYWIRPSYGKKFFGPFEYWNNFACYVPMVAFLALGSLCALVRSDEKRLLQLSPKRIIINLMRSLSNKKVFVIFLSFVLMLGALVLSKSRGGIVCFFAALLFFVSSILVHRYSKKTVLIILLGIFIIFLSLSATDAWNDLGLNTVVKELRTLFSPETYVTRVALYTIDMPKILKEYPFFGVGMGALYDILPSYLSYVPYRGTALKHGKRTVLIHRYLFNDILQLLTEIGVIGFAAILMPFLIFITRTASKIGKTKSRYKYFIGLGLFSSLLFLFLHVMIDFHMTASSISSLFVIILALSVLTVNIDPTKEGQEIEMKKKRLLLLKTKWARRSLYFLSGISFLCLSFVISKPLVAQIITKEGASQASFERAISLEPKNDRLYMKYYEFIIDQHSKGYINKNAAYHKAGLIIDKAIKLNSYRTDYLVAKADLELLNRNYKGASLSYAKAVQLEPFNPIMQMGASVVIFWQALHENNAKKRALLLKKGMIYYNNARLSGNENIGLASVIKNKKTLALLRFELNKNGLDVE